MSDKVNVKKSQHINAVFDKESELLKKIDDYNKAVNNLFSKGLQIKYDLEKELKSKYSMPPVFSSAYKSSVFDVHLCHENMMLERFNVTLQVEKDEVSDFIQDKKTISKIEKLNMAGINVNLLMPHLDKDQRKELLDEIIGD